MINLISNESKRELRAARSNIILRKYIITVLGLLVVVTASYAVGYLLLVTQESRYIASLTQYEPQRGQYVNTIKQANNYSKNLNIAKSILANELAFSSFTTMVAQTTPPDVVLTNLNIESKVIAKPLEFDFKAKSYDNALETKERFESSPYFKDSKIRSISKVAGDTYGYEFVLIVSFEKEPFNKARKEGVL
jgi:hypothetical protein